MTRPVASATRRDCSQSAELTFARGVLPLDWGLNADSQRVGVALDRADRALQADDQVSARRLIRTARRDVELHGLCT